MHFSSIRTIARVSCLLFGAAAWQLGTHSSSDFAARAQTSRAASAGAPQATQMHPVKATVSDPASSASSPPLPTAAPGTEIYTAKRGEAIPTIARRYLGKTSYLTSAELADAIRHVNDNPHRQHPESQRKHRHPGHPPRAHHREDDPRR